MDKLINTLRAAGLTEADIHEVLNKRSHRNMEGIPYIQEFKEFVGDLDATVELIPVDSVTMEVEGIGVIWAEYCFGEFRTSENPYKLRFSYKDGVIRIAYPKVLGRIKELMSSKLYPIEMLRDYTILYNQERLSYHQEKNIELGVQRLRDMLTVHTMYIGSRLWDPIYDAWETGMYIVVYPDKGANFFRVDEKDLEKLQDLTEEILTPERVNSMLEKKKALV